MYNEYFFFNNYFTYCEDEFLVKLLAMNGLEGSSLAIDLSMSVSQTAC